MNGGFMEIDGVAPKPQSKRYEQKHAKSTGKRVGNADVLPSICSLNV